MAQTPVTEPIKVGISVDPEYRYDNMFDLAVAAILATVSVCVFFAAHFAPEDSGPDVSNLAVALPFALLGAIFLVRLMVRVIIHHSQHEERS